MNTTTSRKQIYFYFLILILLFTIIPINVNAVRTYNLNDGSIIINSNDIEDYYIIQTARSGGTTNTITVTGGNHNISIDGLSIYNENLPAIDIQKNSDVVLTIYGNNDIRGGTGYAGIRVEEGATLKILGNGNLNVIGGAAKSPRSGGAGIGSNGGEDCGNIIINGDIKITATGGDSHYNNLNYHGGAGIGAGGGTGDGKGQVFLGNITINNGNITAKGGAPNLATTGGGAGIGTGGCGNVWNPQENKMNIIINNGNIHSTGGYDSAGIGGGNNVNSGNIEINNGTIIAIGMGENDSSHWGGAGIGGGDNGWYNTIKISGKANVKAFGGGSASGIGGGSDGGAWDDSSLINISGSSNILAVGGSNTAKTRGGAGIGGGVALYEKDYANGGRIYIKDSSKVVAYGGSRASAIGNGSGYVGIEKSIMNIDSTIDLELYNIDTTTKAYADIVEGSGEPFLLYYSLPIDKVFPQPSTITNTNNDKFNWEYNILNNIELSILSSNNNELIKNYYPDSEYLSNMQNWAVLNDLIREIPTDTPGPIITPIPTMPIITNTPIPNTPGPIIPEPTIPISTIAPIPISTMYPVNTPGIDMEIPLTGQNTTIRVLIIISIISLMTFIIIVVILKKNK